MHEEDGALMIVGDLTTRGSNREVRLEAELLGLDQSALQGELRIGFSARTTIRRANFGVGQRAIEGTRSPSATRQPSSSICRPCHARRRSTLPRSLTRDRLDGTACTSGEN